MQNLRSRVYGVAGSLSSLVSHPQRPGLSPSTSLSPASTSASSSTDVLPPPATSISPDPRAVCVYCGSSPGISPEYRKSAESLGSALASSSRTIVYGGGDRGLMGIVSNSVIENSGKAIGIIPRSLVLAGGEGRGPVERPSPQTAVEQIQQGARTVKKDVSIVNSGNMQTVVVNSMHERKLQMARIAGAGFVALPGGFGTYEEVLEAITWSQIGINQKPVIILNVNGFYEPLRTLIDGAIKEAFIQENGRRLVTFIDPPPGVAAIDFDWGKAAVDAIDLWSGPETSLFTWDEKGKWGST
ncbi:hypothetical protein FRC04_000975 [Tulasnella sp. 424]|nr:hypothetical protein FRC04_000975 [Tulasnella sp. 424]KAG8977886.1 hypothetical protein FRC05_000414 [Tulasnella sp. 425]